MNPAMWENPATQANLPLLSSRGIGMIGPGTGDTACGETGIGRMAEVVATTANVSRTQSATMAGLSTAIQSVETDDAFALQQG